MASAAMPKAAQPKAAVRPIRASRVVLRDVTEEALAAVGHMLAVVEEVELVVVVEVVLDDVIELGVATVFASHIASPPGT